MHAPYFVDNEERLDIPGSSEQTGVYGRAIRLILDAHGELVDLEQNLPAKRRRKNARVILQLTPGMCFLRQLAVPGLGKKEIESALQLWAEESLPLPVEHYYLDGWKISDQLWGLAAVLREPLVKARKELDQQGVKLLQLQVPELMAPRDLRSGIVLWSGAYGLSACLWQNGILYDWQSFPQGVPANAVLAQLTALMRDAPDWIYLDTANADSLLADVCKAIDRYWPGLIPDSMDDWSVEKKISRLGSGPAFDVFLHEGRYLPATRSDKFRLGLALATLTVAGVFLVFSDLRQIEQQVEVMRHHASLMKVRARRSEQIALRSGQTLRQIYELQAMTAERHGVMSVLKTLGDALPPGVKLENIDIDRDGTAAVDGVAETEVDISSFLERLGEQVLLRSPRLTFTQKDEQRQQEAGEVKSLIRFRVEMRLAQALLQLPDYLEDDAGLAEADEA